MKETIHRLRSAHLGNERTIWVREPRSMAEPFHLVIVLDGEIYRDHMGVGALLDELDAKAAFAPSYFVFVSVADDEARWRENPCHPPFARFIREELLPWIEGAHPATVRSRERVIAGLSYTGLASCYVALNAPGRFTRVIAQSGSLWWNDCWLVEQYRQTTARLPLAFYLDVGLRETAEHVHHRPDVIQVVSQLDSIRRFHAVLRQQGYPVHYVEFDGGHAVAEWKKTLPAALAWALPPD